MTDTCLANARLVLPSEVVTGRVLIRNGRIADIDQGAHVPKGAEDLDGDHLGPGLIELHTDNLERHMRPRPQVNWPHCAAILAHDRELAGCGITTVFDALRLGAIETGPRKGFSRYARPLADSILDLHRAGRLKIRHHLHLRAEICTETLVEELEEFGPDDRVGILSLMNHTPGQRQFRDMEKYEIYTRGKYPLSAEEFQDHVVLLHGINDRLGARHMRAAVETAHRLGATLASHDDTTEAQVAESRAAGVTLAEFPTTIEAARASRAAGMQTILGAPNIIRGSSHSGNVAAQDLAQADLLGILSSDYIPGALLLAAVDLGELWGNLARGIATVTSTPAAVTGLSDRGELRVGAQADLIRFRAAGRASAVQATWVGGRRVA